MTRVKIPAHWIHGRDDIDVNDWFASRGATVTRRRKTVRGDWEIELAEDLTAQQQATVIDAITARLNSVRITTGH